MRTKNKGSENMINYGMAVLFYQKCMNKPNYWIVYQKDSVDLDVSPIIMAMNV